MEVVCLMLQADLEYDADNQSQVRVWFLSLVA